MNREGVTAIRGPLSSSRDARQAQADRQTTTDAVEGNTMGTTGWWIVIAVVSAGGALVAFMLAMLKSGKRADDARWRAMGLNPEQVRNDEEIAYLREWADRKTARKQR